MFSKLFYGFRLLYLPSHCIWWRNQTQERRLTLEVTIDKFPPASLQWHGKYLRDKWSQLTCNSTLTQLLLKRLQCSAVCRVGWSCTRHIIKKSKEKYLWSSQCGAERSSSHTVEDIISDAAVTKRCSVLLQKFQSCLLLVPGGPEEKSLLV